MGEVYSVRCAVHGQGCLSRARVPYGTNEKSSNWRHLQSAVHREHSRQAMRPSDAYLCEALPAHRKKRCDGVSAWEGVRESIFSYIVLHAHTHSLHLPQVQSDFWEWKMYLQACL